MYLPSANEAGRACAGAGVGVGVGVGEDAEVVVIFAPGTLRAPGAPVDPGDNECPQESQNLASARTLAEQLGHARARAVPHPSQNEAPSRFSWPQDWQFIALCDSSRRGVTICSPAGQPGDAWACSQALHASRSAAAVAAATAKLTRRSALILR